MPTNLGEGQGLSLLKICSYVTRKKTNCEYKCRIPQKTLAIKAINVQNQNTFWTNGIFLRESGRLTIQSQLIQCITLAFNRPKEFYVSIIWIDTEIKQKPIFFLQYSYPVITSCWTRNCFLYQTGNGQLWKVHKKFLLARR